MAKRGVRLLVAVCVLASISTVAQAQQTVNSASTVVPRLIKFSGNLLDERGSAMKGPVGVTFALYNGQSGGAALWMETQNVELDSNGNYTVLLGGASAKGIPQELFASGEARWLGIQVENQAEQPRVLLVSVPYALKAADAETLGGLPPSAFASARSTPAESSSAASSSSSLLPLGAASTASSNNSTDPNVTTPGGTVNFLPKFDTPSDVKTSQIFDNGTDVGIGFPVTPTPIPVAKLDVDGSVNVRGTLQLPASGTANSTTKGFNSEPFDYLASVFNGKAAANQHFRWQAEPVNPGLSTASGKLNLLFASGTGTLAETGLSINNKGILTFASGQPFPTVTGNETVTGNLSAGQLISTVANGTAPLKVTSTSLVPNLNANLLGGLPAGAFATLLGANNFLGPQSILGGNVGIGTTTPPGRLSVASTNPALGAGTGPVFNNLPEWTNAYTTFGPNVATAGGAGSGALALGYSATDDTALIVSLSPNQAWRPLKLASGGFLIDAADGKEAMRVTSDGEVGIGTTTPNAVQLEVIAATGRLGLEVLGANSSTFGPDAVVAVGGSGGGNGLFFGGAGVNATGGSVAASGGSGGPGIRAIGGLNGDGVTRAIAAGFDGDISVAGCVIANGGNLGTCSSDVRLKTNIQPYPAVLEKLVRLQPVSYNWKTDEYLQLRFFGSSRTSGLIAQEVEQVFPEMVSVDEGGFKRVNYGELPYLMLQAIRELKAENDDLRERIQRLEKAAASTP